MAIALPGGSGAMGVGGEGDPSLISQAASATLPQDPNALAAELIKNLTAARMGPGGGLVTAPQMAKPNLPLPPIKSEPQGAIPQGPFASVGERKRADKQAAFNTIGNLVNKAQDRIYQQKVQKIQHDLETLNNAITGYKEAQASGNQEMMKHNADIINNIVMDPKKSKELAKAFDVNMNPMAPDKKKDKPDPSKDAAKAFFAQDTKSFQSGATMLSPQAQALMRATPQTLQTDPRAAAMMEAAKAGLIPKAGEVLQFQGKVMEIQQKIDANKVTNETKLQMAKNLTEAMMNRTLMQQYGATIRTQMMQMGAHDRAEIMANALRDRAKMVLEGQNNRTNMLRDRLQAATNDQGKKLLVLMKGLDDAAKKNSKDMEDAKKQGDSARMQWLNQQADGIAFQQRLVNDQAERMVGIDPQEPPDKKNMGLSDSEYELFRSIFSDTTQPSGEKESDDEE